MIGLLEEYLTEYRPNLLRGADPTTLFLNQDGTPMDDKTVTDVVSQLMLKHGGRRVTPHLFRDIYSYAWLKDHRGSYLELSKMLWHRSPKYTLEVYGSRFNESSGVCAAESWIEEREARSK